jgi:hypothetical protein
MFQVLLLLHITIIVVVVVILMCFNGELKYTLNLLNVASKCVFAAMFVFAVIDFQYFTSILHVISSMKSFQALRSPAIPLTSFHDLPVLLISSFVVLRHVLFGLPLLFLVYPWGFQSNAVFSIAPSWMPCAPQGLKGTVDDDKDYTWCTECPKSHLTLKGNI